MRPERAEGARSFDLKRSLHTVEVEIERYESILRSTPEHGAGFADELVKLRSYRGEIIAKLKHVEH